MANPDPRVTPTNPSLQQPKPTDLAPLVTEADNREFTMEMVNELRRAVAERNTIRYSEFMEFAPLWQHNARDAIGAQYYDTLCFRLRERISLYHPIRIVSDDDTKVMLTLPSIFMEQDSFNVLGENGPKVIVALHNVCEDRVDAFDHKKKHYAELSKEVFLAIQENLASPKVEATHRIIDLINEGLPHETSAPSFDDGSVEIL